MDEQNILHRMLAKGDHLRSRYDSFDFTALDQTQQKYLNRLSFFAHHRERILRKFNGTSITHDVKIAFLDQHSMKLGNHIFYDIESKRQDYITSFDIMPFSTAFFGFLFFCGFAIRAPMTSKLYKELGYSVVMAGALSYVYVHQQKKKYLAKVDEIYEQLKYKFATNPILSTMKEDEQILKNFGYHKYADKDDQDDDGPFDEEELKEMGIFEGDVTKEKDEYKERLLEMIYGK